MFCVDCGTNLPDAAKFCSSCGKQTGLAITQATAATATGTAPARETEKTILDLGSVIVTDKRFVVPGQTFALSQITSVSTGSKTNVDGGHVFGALILILGALLGIGAFVANAPSDQAGFGIIGAIAAIAGIVFMVMAKQHTTFSVLIHNSGGEVRAFESEKAGDVQQIVQAVTEAIALRA